MVSFRFPACTVVAVLVAVLIGIARGVNVNSVVAERGRALQGDTGKLVVLSWDVAAAPHPGIETCLDLSWETQQHV